MNLETLSQLAAVCNFIVALINNHNVKRTDVRDLINLKLKLESLFVNEVKQLESLTFEKSTTKFLDDEKRTSVVLTGDGGVVVKAKEVVLEGSNEETELPLPFTETGDAENASKPAKKTVSKLKAKAKTSKKNVPDLSNEEDMVEINKRVALEKAKLKAQKKATAG